MFIRTTLPRVTSASSLQHGASSATTIGAGKVFELITQAAMRHFPSQQKQSLVTRAAYGELREINEGIAKPPKQTRYFQKPDECEFLATDQLEAFVREGVARQRRASQAADDETAAVSEKSIWKKVWNSLVSATSPQIAREDLPKNAEVLFNFYKKHGPLVIRTPWAETRQSHLEKNNKKDASEGTTQDDEDQYFDHAILVTAIVKANVNGTPRIGLFVRDGNDGGADAQFSDLQKHAKDLGKKHVSELTNEEVEKADGQRIGLRVISAEEFLNHAFGKYRTYVNDYVSAHSKGNIEKYSHRDDGFPLSPIMRFHVDGKPFLSPEEDGQLQRWFAENYDTDNVEKAWD